METIKLGTLYMGNIIVSPERKYGGPTLTLGDTTEESELSWVKVNGLLVSDHVYCIGISWNRFNKWGFIYGKRVTIDGKPYFCRSLQVGGSEDIISEWDSILDAAGDSDDLWHWKHMMFWGKDKESGLCAVRGYDSARGKGGFYRPDFGQEATGFRPVLEPLSFGCELSELLVDNTIKAFGPEGLPITGIVQELSDYDLFLLPTSGAAVPANSNWCARQEDGLVIMDRSAIAFSEGY